MFDWLSTDMEIGMMPIESRRTILKCFEAFKRFVDDLEMDTVVYFEKMKRS